MLVVVCTPKMLLPSDDLCQQDPAIKPPVIAIAIGLNKTNLDAI